MKDDLASRRIYDKRPLLVETFVDAEGYKDTCYHAAGWTKLGQTQGYARVSEPQYYQGNERPKYLWVKPLAKDALACLRAPSRLPPPLLFTQLPS